MRLNTVRNILRIVVSLSLALGYVGWTSVWKRAVLPATAYTLSFFAYVTPEPNRPGTASADDESDADEDEASAAAAAAKEEEDEAAAAALAHAMATRKQRLVRSYSGDPSASPSASASASAHPTPPLPSPDHDVCVPRVRRAATVVSLHDLVDQESAPCAEDSVWTRWAKWAFPDVWWVWCCAGLKRGSERVVPFEELVQAIAADPPVRAAARGSPHDPAFVADVRALLGELSATHSVFAQRLVLLGTLKILRLLYSSGLFVDLEDLAEVLQQVAEKPTAALLLLPTHRSAIDYLLVWYMCVVTRLPLPYMVAEAKYLSASWLRPLLIPLARSLGSIFPDNARMETDTLYGEVYASYMRQLVLAGATLQCFIEGSRSRTGKSKRPRLGLARFLVDAVRTHPDTDAIVTCLGVSHARVIENSVFVDELVGGSGSAPHQGSPAAGSAAPSLGSLGSDSESAAFIAQLVSRILRRQFSLGSVDMGISTPFGLRDFVARQWGHQQWVFGFCGVRASALDIPNLSRVSLPSRSLQADFTRVAPAPVDASEPAGALAYESASSDSDAADVQSSSDSESCFAGVISAGPGRTAQFAHDLAARLDELTLASPPPAQEWAGWTNRVAEENLAYVHGGESDAYLVRLNDVAHGLVHHVMHLCNHASVIVPSAIVGTILLTNTKRGLSKDALVRCVSWLRKEVMSRGFRVAARSKSPIGVDVLRVVDRVLGSSDNGSDREMVKRFRGDTLLFGLYSPAERMLLVFYRNQLMHVFLGEALVCAAMYSVERERKSFPGIASGRELRRYTHFLAQLFRLEFAFPPSSFHRDTFSETLHALVGRDVFSALDPSGSTDPHWATGSPTASDVDSTRFVINTTYDADEASESFSSHGTGMYMFLCSLIWPFIDSYWLAALGLFALLDRPSPVPIHVFITHIQNNVGEAVFFAGQLDLYEANSRDTLANAITLFTRWGILTATPAGIRLTPEYNDDSAIQRLTRRLASFKKRSRSYSSRRYRTRSGVRSDVEDAEALARTGTTLLSVLLEAKVQPKAQADGASV